MANRTALITGVLGQDGSLLAELLLARGYRVTGVARSSANQPASGPLSMVRIATADLTDRAAVTALLRDVQPDEVYHLAAFHHSSQDSSVSAATQGKDAMLAVNFLMTKTLAFAISEMAAPCHLVFASSSQVYTALRARHAVDESDPRQPATFYGHAKSWSMDLLAFLRSESGLRASSAILFNHESPRRGAQFVTRKITRAAALAKAGTPPGLALQNIGARVDWSSAHDVVAALSMMARSPAAGDYVIASGTLHSIRDLLTVAFGHVGLDWQQFTSYQEDRETPALVGTTRAIESELGWQRSTTFEQVIVEMVEHDLRSIC